MKSRYAFSAAMIVLCALFASCANTSPEIFASSASVVFDYRDEESYPKVRLSVFTETGSDARRAASVKIVSQNGGMEWTAEAPLVIGAERRQWAGYTGFVWPDGRAPEEGSYTVQYTDAQGRTVQNTFVLDFPENLAETKATDAVKKLGNDAQEYIAAYMADGTLIYYNRRKPEWNTDGALWDGIKLASSIRICYSVRNGSVICLMPEQQRPSSKNAQ
jgi:hypothetical protein